MLPYISLLCMVRMIWRHFAAPDSGVGGLLHMRRACMCDTITTLPYLSAHKTIFSWHSRALGDTGDCLASSTVFPTVLPTRAHLPPRFLLPILPLFSRLKFVPYQQRDVGSPPFLMNICCIPTTPACYIVHCIERSRQPLRLSPDAN